MAFGRKEKSKNIKKKENSPNDDYVKHLNRFLLNLPEVVRPGAEDFFKSTYGNIQEYDDISVGIKRKQILWISMKLNNIFDKEIVGKLNKNSEEKECVKKFYKLCEIVVFAIQDKKYPKCDSVLKQLNEYCMSKTFLQLYERIEKYKSDPNNFK